MNAVVDEIVLIRNTQRGPTVHTSLTGQLVEWAGAGDQAGGDVQPVSTELMREVPFQRAMVRGILVKEVERSMAEIEELHRRDWESSSSRRETASLDALDVVTDNDFLMVPCIMPTGRAGSSGTCAVDVPMTAKAMRDKPALCPGHIHEAPKFMAEEQDKIVGGKPTVVWSMIQLGQRERQQ